MLEMAFVLLPLMALVCGIVDFSMVMYFKHVFQNAVNQAVRFGITYRMSYTRLNGTTVNCATQRSCILEVLYDNSQGYITAAKNTNKYNEKMVFVNWYTPDNLDSAATANPVNATGNVLQVNIDNFIWDWIMPIWAFLDIGRTNSQQPPHFRLGAQATDIMQALPVGVLSYPSAK